MCGIAKPYRYSLSTLKWIAFWSRSIPIFLTLCAFANFFVPTSKISNSDLGPLYPILFNSGAACVMLLFLYFFSSRERRRLSKTLFTVRNCVLTIEIPGISFSNPLELRNVKEITFGETRWLKRRIVRLKITTLRTVIIQELHDMDVFLEELKECVSVPVVRSETTVSPWTPLQIGFGIGIAINILAITLLRQATLL